MFDRRAGKTHRACHQRHLAGDRMRHFDFHATRDHLRLFEHLLQRVDRAVSNTGVVEQLHPLFGAAFGEDGAQQIGNLGAVLHARGVGREFRIRRELHATGDFAEFLEQVVVAAGENDRAVRRVERLVRHDVRMRVADALGRHAGCQIVLALIGQVSHGRVEQCDIDPLALAGDGAIRQCGANRNRRVHAGGQIDDRHAAALRAAAGHIVGFAGDAHHAAHALRHEIVTGAVFIGPGLAEARHRTINEARIDLREVFVAETVTRQITDLVIFEQHVALCGELAHQLLALGFGEIHGDRTLAAIGSAEVGRLFRLFAVLVFQKRRRVGTRIVAFHRTLDLDHVGAEVSEVLRRPGGGQHARHVENFDVGERAGHILSFVKNPKQFRRSRESGSPV